MMVMENKNKLYLPFKRIFDFVVSLIGIIVLSPFFLIIPILIKRDSPGPVFFRQKRIGKGNKEFMIFKFRTMRIDTPNVAKEILKNSPNGMDTYMTEVGKKLRKNAFDEIPQIINILKGDMSLVGPRPALFNQYDLIKMRTEKNIHSIRPGMTGWAIINGGEDLSLEEKVDADEYYLKNLSFGLDINIILKTISVMRSKKGVY
jgi:O-antigen biosynthesis protein WbqP